MSNYIMIILHNVLIVKNAENKKVNFERNK